MHFWVSGFRGSVGGPGDCNFGPQSDSKVTFRGFATLKGGFQTSGFGRCSPVPKTRKRVHSDAPPYQQPGQGHIIAKPALLRNLLFFFLSDFSGSKSLGACAMTTKCFDNKICTFKFCCYGVSQEKQRFGRFPSLSPLPTLKNANFIFNVVPPSLKVTFGVALGFTCGQPL